MGDFLRHCTLYMPFHETYWTLEYYIDLALQMSGSAFTVGVAEEETLKCFFWGGGNRQQVPLSAGLAVPSINTIMLASPILLSSVHQSTTTQSQHKMAAMSPAHKMAASSSPAHKMASSPPSYKVATTSPPAHKMESANLPPAHKMASCSCHSSYCSCS